MKNDNFNIPELSNNIDYQKILSNSIFSSPYRLTILVILNSTKFVGFSDLMKLLKLSSGKLDYHLKTLEKSGYISRKKIIFPKRPLIYLSITRKGRNTFEKYIRELKNLINNIGFE